MYVTLSVKITHFPNLFSGFTFYKMSNLDNRIANADQLLTTDVEKFCEGIVELYSNLSKVCQFFYLFVNDARIKTFLYSPSIALSFNNRMK